MTGQFDFLLRVVCADLAAYEAFLREKLTQLEGVGSIEFELLARAGEVFAGAADLSAARRRPLGYPGCGPNLHGIGVKMPGGVPEHRHHDQQPEEGRQHGDEA